jgi:DNA-binding MarR family transcriptional regulator
VADDSPDDTELERLLTQLLRVVSPAIMAGTGETDVPDGGAPVPDGRAPEPSGGTPAPDGGTPVPDGRTPAPDGGTPAPDGRAAPGRAAPGRAADARPGIAAGWPAVSASEARALAELVTARGLAQGELAGLLGLEKSTVSRLAAGLERKGWIRRGRDEDNQRYVRLYLTPEGRAVAARVWQAWHSRQARILAALSDEERAGLSSGLRGLVRGLAAEGLLGDGVAGD